MSGNPKENFPRAPQHHLGSIRQMLQGEPGVSPQQGDGKLYTVPTGLQAEPREDSDGIHTEGGILGQAPKKIDHPVVDEDSTTAD